LEVDTTMDEFRAILEIYQQSNKAVVESQRDLTEAITVLNVKLDEDIRLASNSQELVQEVCIIARNSAQIQTNIVDTLKAIEEHFSNGFRTEIKEYVDQSVKPVSKDVQSIKRDINIIKWAVSSVGIIATVVYTVLKFVI